MNEKTIKGARGKHIKLIIQVVFFASLIVFALLYVLKDDPQQTFATLGQASFFPLLGAIGILLFSLLFDGLNITLLARLYNGRYHYYQGLINTSIGQVLGVFVKSAACIPQAMTFTKQDIKSAQGASILTMNYLLYQLSLFLYSVFIVIFGYSYVKDVPIELLGGLSLFSLCIIALSVQFIILIAIFSLGFARRLHRLVLNNGINLVSKLHILRNPEMTRRKLTLQFATYRIEMKRLFQHKRLVLIILLSNLIRQFLLGSIPFMIFLSLKADMSHLTFDTSLFLTGYVNTISSLISVGVPEVMFQSAFGFYLSGEATALASAANLLWRSVTFYLLFAIGLACLLLYRGAPKRQQLLSNTQTIYDLELSNILEADDETKKYLEDVRLHGNRNHAPLLSERQVEASFRNIRKDMIRNGSEEKKEEVDNSLAEALEQQRKNLAKIQHDVSMIIKQDKPDKEIQKEAENEMLLQSRTNLKRQERKNRRAKKKEEKAKRRLLKLQPKGTTIKEGEDGSIIYVFDNEMTECVSLPGGGNEDDQEDL